jgi:tRNA 2-thiouridine synthesizing protein D
MRFTLLILTPPEAGDANARAAAFARTLLAAGHELACAFFHDSAVLTGLDRCEAPQDEEDTRAAWTGLARDHGVKLVACVASAARHGVDESRLGEGFAIGGLGELVDASHSSDRVLTFAN